MDFSHVSPIIIFIAQNGIASLNFAEKLRFLMSDLNVTGQISFDMITRVANMALIIFLIVMKLFVIFLEGCRGESFIAVDTGKFHFGMLQPSMLINLHSSSEDFAAKFTRLHSGFMG